MKGVALFAIILFHLSIPSSTEPIGLTIDLIHRDSPLSPYYNPSMTQSDFLINAAFRSISRVKSFNFTPPQNKADQTILIPNSGDYLMQIFIGTPPRISLAIADTASNLIWVQCSPCRQCYKQDLPVFDPSKSYTYHLIPCDNISCSKYLLKHSCGNAGECIYGVHYADDSSSEGTLSTEVISFNNSYVGQIVKYPNTIFGCGHKNTGIFKPAGEGVVGLGGGPLSLVSQIGDQLGKRKFSYCLLPSYFKSNSKMMFGVDTQKYRRAVVTTPLVKKFPSTFYYVSLESVSISGKVVKPYQTEGNIIIDSGTTLSFLNSDLYDKVEAAVVEAIGDQSFAERDPPEPFKLCYRFGSIKNYPNIAFHFFGANHGLDFSQTNIFVRIREFTCLLMVPSDDGRSILGNIQQLFFNVEFDLDEKTVSFAPADCTEE